MKTEVVIWILVISFSAYFLISWVFKKLHLNNLVVSLQVVSGLRLLNLKHVLGIIFFGVLPFVLIPDSRFLILSIQELNTPTLILFLFLTFLCVYVSCLGVKNNDEVISANETCLYRLSESIGYFAVRFMFLLCYEFFFRGIMFFYFLESYGLTLSIGYVTFFYVLIHVFDSKREMLGAIPFGIVLCLFSYYTNSVWYAFVLHLVLSAVYEISVFYRLTLKNKLLS